MTLSTETNYTTGRNPPKGCEDDTVFAFSASDDMLEELSGITPRLLRPNSVFYKQRNEDQDDQGDEALDSEDYLSFVASPRLLATDSDGYHHPLQTMEDVRTEDLEDKGSTEDVFFVPRVNFITGESPSSTKSGVSQRTFTGDAGDSLDMSEQNYGAEHNQLPNEFGVHDSWGDNAVELSRPAGSKSLTATFGVDPSEFSYKSYENIIDSFANVAQQNYKLWLNRV